MAVTEQVRSTIRFRPAVMEEVQQAAAIEGMAVNTWLEAAARFTLANAGQWEVWREAERRRERAERAAERRGG